MERLWAPWRKAYIRVDQKSKGKGCLFCSLLKEKRDSSNFILTRSAYSFAVLNLYPYNNGHILILPIRHVPEISDLGKDEKLDWLETLEAVQSAVAKCMTPDGYNLGVNLGRAAGAGIPEHLHLHLVPRWKGDVNFMPVTGGTKVISESLKSVYQELSQELRGRPPRRPKRSGKKTSGKRARYTS